MIIIGYILVIISAIAKAVMDKIQFHYYDSVFSRFDSVLYWNPEVSWMMKYKDGNPSKGEKFKFSTTLFVFLTDAWHLAQFIFLNSLVIGCFVIFCTKNFTNGIIHLLIITFIFKMTFQLFFNYIFEKKHHEHYQ